MSTDAFAVAVLPDPPGVAGDLILAVDETGALFEVRREQRGGDVLRCFHDWDGLVERIAQSASVVIEHRGEPAPELPGPRPPGCADGPWLTRVAGCLLPVLPDLSSRCQLASAALSRMAGARVTFASRPIVSARRGWERGRRGGPRFRFGGRWVRELAVKNAAASPGSPWNWSLVIPDDLPASDAAALAGHPLAVKLADLLAPAESALCGEPFPRPVLALVRAVVTDDAGAFAAAAASLTDGVVTVVGSDGVVIASSSGQERGRLEGAWVPAGEAREILLCDDAGLHGAIRISADRLGSTPPPLADLGRLLGDLGLVLIRSIQSGRRSRNLENQLAMLSCLAGSDLEGPFWRERTLARSTARRLVIVRAAGPVGGNAGARLLDAVLRAAERSEILSGLCMVVSQGSLVGLYPDTGPQPARHRRSWAGVLGEVRAGGPLTAAVSSAVSDGGDFPGQHRMLCEVAEIQQSGSRYLSLPQVAMVDELGPLAEVIGATPGRGFAAFVERVLGDLLDDQRFGGQLIETLYAYLQTGGSLQEAGRLLHLHPSTVKYRIRVIRELLGPQLADRSTRLDLELAVRLYLAAERCGQGPSR